MAGRGRIFVAFLIALVLTACPAAAGENAAWRGEIREIWNSIWDSNQYELLFPINIYHVRATYDKEKTDEYNEQPWGGGIEKYYHRTETDTYHSLYFVAFQDSYSYIEPTFGYTWQKKADFIEGSGFRGGLGFSAIITFRNAQNYVPIPGVLPCVTLEFKDFAVQTAWIPYLGHNDGNVFFTVLKWKFTL